MINLSKNWLETYPDARIGILIMNDVHNPAYHAQLEHQKVALERNLREQFKGKDVKAIRALASIQAYAAYYKRFKKTYHVQLQLESIVFKEKSIPSVAGLVEAMFMAELKNQILAAGHDLDTLQMPLTVESAQGTEQYILLRGEEQLLKPKDMFIADQVGVISSIIYGPDQRTQIGPETCNVLFTVYAPTGIDRQMVQEHLETIQDFVFLFCPDARTNLLDVFSGKK